MLLPQSMASELQAAVLTLATRTSVGLGSRSPHSSNLRGLLTLKSG